MIADPAERSASEAAPPRLEGWLLDLDRRRRAQRALETAALVGVVLATIAYLLRWLGAPGVATWNPGVLLAILVSLTAGVWLALTALGTRDPAGAARTVDTQRHFDDLVTTAWHLERRETEATAATVAQAATADGQDGQLRHSIHGLVRRRAATALDGVEPSSVAPWKPSCGSWIACAVLLLSPFLPLPPRPTGEPSRSAVLLVDEQKDEDQEHEAAEDDNETPTQERPSDAFPTAEEEPVRIELRNIAELDPRLAQLLQGERADLSAEDLAALADAEGLSADALARLEELAERLDPNEPMEPADDAAHDPADPTALGENPPGSGFEELGRERSDAPTPLDSPKDGDQQAAGGSQSGQGGEQQPAEAGSEAPGGAEEAAAQTIELPPTPTGEQMQAADAAAAANALGEGAMAAGDQAGEQAGQQQPGAGGGDATGPQAGESELFGDGALVDEAVTLELTLLKAREENEERPQRPERRWRASRAEDSTVRVQRAKPGDWTAPDEESRTPRLPRRHRELLRNYFTPPEQPKQQDPPGRL